VIGTQASRDGSGDGAVIRRVTLAGMVVNILLAGLKFAFGIIGHSQALVADAAHSLSDLGTDLALIIGVRYWTAPADDDHAYGHHRIETMVSAVIGLFLAAAAVGIGYRALTSIRDAASTPPGWIAFAGALVSIVLKEILYRWTAAASRRIRSTALAANAWHHRSDALSSLPVALAVLVAIYYPDWSFVDQVGALLVTVFLLHAAWRILFDALGELTDRSAPSGDRRRILELSRGIDGVRDIHALRTRLSGGPCAGERRPLGDGRARDRRGGEKPPAGRGAGGDGRGGAYRTLRGREPAEELSGGWDR